MAAKKIVFQVYANPKGDVDVHVLYEHAIIVSAIDDCRDMFYDHGNYIESVLKTPALRDDVKYPGIKFNTNSKGVLLSGQDYVAFEPDEYGHAEGKTMSAGQTVTFNIIKEYAASKGFVVPDYVQKFDAAGIRGAYDSCHAPI